MTTHHLGIDKKLAKNGDIFWWPGITTDAKDWETCCESCSRKKMPAVKPCVPLTNSTVGRPLDTIVMDFLGPLPETNKGNKHLLIVTDYYTNWAKATAYRIGWRQL